MSGMRSDASPAGLPPLEFERIDRTAVRTFASFDEADRADRAFWLSRTPEERMRALEHVRQLAWGYSDADPQPRLPRTVGAIQLRAG